MIIDSLKIRLSFDGLAPVSHSDVSPCSHCSHFEHVELDCPMMAIQGQFPFRPNPTTYLGLSQEGTSNYPNEIFLVFISHLMRSSGAGSALHSISPLNPRHSIWGTRGRHLSAPVFPERLHRHRQYHFQNLQLIPS